MSSHRVDNITSIKVKANRAKWRIVLKYRSSGFMLKEHSVSGYLSKEAAEADKDRFVSFFVGMESFQTVRDFHPIYVLDDIDNDEEMTDIFDSGASCSSGKKRATSAITGTRKEGKLDAITKKAKKKVRRVLRNFNKLMEELVCS